MAKTTGRKKRKALIRTIVLAAVFLAALTGYFVWSFFNTEKEFTVYTSMAEPTLPVVYASAYGQELNCMHGYLQDMGNAASSDSITPLPEDRRLSLRIAEYNNMITGISYEIRSLDLEHFIERTTVDDFRREDGNVYAELPIQNLIEKDTQYLLSLKIDTGEQEIHYYTRILWTDSTNGEQMLRFAREFAEKTFDYDAARDLTTYLETNNEEDNTSLGRVTLRSNFSQLTWGDMGMQLATDIDVCLKEFDGIMGAVELHYMTTRQNEMGETERYQVVDEYTMRVGAERIYLMDYVRTTNQIFEGNKTLFSGKRILLGITDPRILQAEKSENDRYIAFTANRELWVYDQDNKRATNVFSFRSGVDDGVRANYDRHGIRILSIEDNGDVDFVVYGYMNRGQHEGWNGIAYYQYSRSNDTMTESFFLPVAETYEQIALELSELCIKGPSDMFYLKQNGSIAAIDLKSLEMMEIANGLIDGNYAISRDQTKVAWQDGPLYESRSLRFMDILSGSTRTITSSEGDYLRVLGFMEQDLVYGSARENDQWMLAGCIRALPMYKLEIVSPGSLEALMTYQKEGIYVERAAIEGSRIHLTQVRKNEGDESGHSYHEINEDTIIYQQEMADTALANIGSSITEDRNRIYYVELDQEIRTTRSLKVSVPRKISYERSGTIELMLHEEPENQIHFTAYAQGQLVGESHDFETAVNLCYDGLGWVKDKDGYLLYNRTDRESRGRAQIDFDATEGFLQHLSEFSGSRKYEDGWYLLNGQGLSLNQVLYYVYQGYPVAAYLENGQYRLLSSFDNFNVYLVDPEVPEEEIPMGLEDAEHYFAENQNAFICGLYLEE